MSRRLVAALLAMGTVATACSSSSSEGTGPAPTTTVVDAATTTTIADGVVRPIGPAVGVSWEWTNEDRFAPHLEPLSGAVTWFELEWCDVEPEPGALDLKRLDRALERSDRFGIELYVKIRTGSCWVTDGQRGEEWGALGFTPSAPPVDEDAYRGFVAAVVERARAAGVRRYAIENEPNVSKFWAGTVEEYAHVLRLGAEAVRAADPDAVVLDGGVSSRSNGYLLIADLLATGRDEEARDAWHQFFSRRPPVFAAVPIGDLEAIRSEIASESVQRTIGLLEAGLEAARAGVTDAYQLHHYDDPRFLDDVVALLRSRLGPDVPIEAWELGARSLPDPTEDDARIDVLHAQIGAIANDLRVAIMLPLQYGSEGVEVRHGLVDRSGTERPAWEFLRRWNEALLAVDDPALAQVTAFTLRGTKFALVGDDTVTTVAWWSATERVDVDGIEGAVLVEERIIERAAAGVFELDIPAEQAEQRLREAGPTVIEPRDQPVATDGDA